MNRRIRLIVIMALWKRSYVARFVLDHLNRQRCRLDDKLSLEVVTVGSEGAVSEQLAATHDAYYVEYDNQPLGAKWNAALAAARERDPDAVMILGSDNIVNDALLCRWADEIHDGMDCLGVLDNHMYRPSTGTLLYWGGYSEAAHHIHRRGETIGSARCYGRELLDRLGWILWDDTLNTSLDYSVTCRLRELDHLRAGFYRIGEIQHLGIKTSVGLTPMGQFIRQGAAQICSVPSEFLVAWYSEEVATQLRALDTKKDDHGATIP